MGRVMSPGSPPPLCRAASWWARVTSPGSSHGEREATRASKNAVGAGVCLTWEPRCPPTPPPTPTPQASQTRAAATAGLPSDACAAASAGHLLSSRAREAGCAAGAYVNGRTRWGESLSGKAAHATRAAAHRCWVERSAHAHLNAYSKPRLPAGSGGARLGGTVLHLPSPAPSLRRHWQLSLCLLPSTKPSPHSPAAGSGAVGNGRDGAARGAAVVASGGVRVGGVGAGRAGAADGHACSHGGVIRGSGHLPAS